VTGTLPACTEGCQSVDECVEDLQAVDLDNWSCTDGACKYTGCLSDDECAADRGVGSRCLAEASGLAFCVTGCSEPADCVVDGTPVTHNADNWECSGGLCLYTGCSSDAECTEAQTLPAVCVRPGE
jgi:hypothetical protein